MRLPKKLYVNHHYEQPSSEPGNRPHLGWMIKPVFAAVLIITACFSSSLMAQTSGLSSVSLADGDPQAESMPRNAYAENLKPRVKRPALVQNQPYSPIKKYDDSGQIPEIEMFVGESRVFPTPGVARIAVGNGQILTAAALDGKETILFANGVGTSSLFVWSEDGRYQRVKISIVPGDTTRIAREVAAFLTTIPNTKASIVGDKVIVEGEQLTDADLSKIEQLEKRYPQIINFTNRLGWEQMVMIDVKVVEFPIDELREIGMKWGGVGGAAIGGIWRPIRRGNDGPYQVNVQSGQNSRVPITSPDGMEGGVVLPSGLNIIGAANLGLNGQLALLAQDGKATILAEPQLAARNGSKASFLAGGEFPYSVSNVNGVTIVFKPYGIKLDVEPKVDRNGIIRATIESEVSKIDGSVSTVGGPALLTRKTKTEFNVRNGETIVLSGLIQLDNSTSIEKVPLLGDIPVLGALFRSKRFQNRETELVIFVTPTVVDSNSPGLVDRIERTNERLKQNLEQNSLLTNPLQPGHDLAQPNTVPRSRQADRDQGASLNERQTTTQVRSSTVKVASSDMGSVGVSSAPTYQPNAVEKSKFPSPNLSSAVKSGSMLKVLKEGIVLRAEPTHKSSSLLQLARGAVVELGSAATHISSGDQWRNVVVGALVGWVPSDAIELSHRALLENRVPGNEIADIDREGHTIGSGQPGENLVTSANKARPFSAVAQFTDSSLLTSSRQQFRVELERLALRVAPDINASVVQHLSRGQIVFALPLQPEGNWRAVEFGSARGWAASQWLTPANTKN